MCSSVRAAVALAVLVAISASAAGAHAPRKPLALKPAMRHSTRVAFMGYLPDKRVATVYADGRVTIAPPALPANADRRTRLLAARQRAHDPSMRPMQTRVSPQRYGPLTGTVLPATRAQILADLAHPPQRYIPGRVVVVFKNGVTMPQDHTVLPQSAAATLVRGVLARSKTMTPHAFTTDARTNLTLMQLGVVRADRLLSNVDRGTLSSLRARAQARTPKALLPIENAFVLRLGASSVDNAVRTLRASTSVAYVTPDYTVSAMNAGVHPLPAAVQAELASYKRTTKTFGRSVKSVVPSSLPTNSAVQFNVQAMLGATGVDAVAAFDEIGRAFNQLPGTGEIVTNIGLGDVYDASVGANPNDPCQPDAQYTGATTHLIGGQQYLDWPSMPLIPVWTTDPDGKLYADGEACYVDAQLGEVGLDFSVMAPLPDAQQRPGESTASAALDLLGIAPGASYRWVAPGTTTGALGISDLAGAFFGAARQVPAPNVITASIGWGADFYGFPSRFIEDDPIMQSVVASVVSSGVVVCLAANDGTRLFQLSAVGPSGGSAATNAGTTGITNLDDLYYSTAPSTLPDDGAIDVGATTLDDIFSVNPQDATAGASAMRPTYAETRYNGTLSFSSGFGSRVNIAAPGDNIEQLFHTGVAYDTIASAINGGTSAAAPEVAAAAAVAMQVARLTGHPLATPGAVRDALVASGTPVANPPQLDVVANVGPQVSVRRVVEQLLAAGGKPVQPGIARVAVHGRRSGSFLAINENLYLDGVYVTALDPAFVKLDGPYVTASPNVARSPFPPGSDTAAELNSYITIAPDWEGIPANATYRLTVAAQPGRVIATTPSARMLPAQLFAAAGVPLTPGATRTIAMTYAASVGLHVVAESTFSITFGPPAPSSRRVLAPVVPPVVTGATIPVTYDVRSYPAALAQNPTLHVSVPGEGSALFLGSGGFELVPYYSTPLPSNHGIVNVPVSALAGAGTYTVWIDMQPALAGSDLSDPAFVRVDAGTARPPAPLLSSAPGQPAWHSLSVPYRSPFAVTYDVSNVTRATGAIVELSAPPAPLFYAVYGSGMNTFRNPNGNALDDDGVITGSLYHVTASGTSGTVTIDPAAAGIPPTTTVNVRVLPASGGTPIAEASDIATVEYHGIAPAAGTPVNQIEVNANGTDGLLSESFGFGTNQVGVSNYTLESFDVGAGAVTGVPMTFTTNNTEMLPIVQNDTEITEWSADNSVIDLFRGTPIEGPYTQISLPAPPFTPSTWVWTTAMNSSPTRSAYLTVDYASGAWNALSGDAEAGSWAAPVDLTSIVGPNVDVSSLFPLGFDPSANRAYLVLEDATVPCDQQSPQLVTVDFGTSTASSRTLPIGAGSTYGGGFTLAVDPATHTGAIATSCQFTDAGGDEGRAELTLLDLQSGATSRVFQRTLNLAQTTHGYPTLLGGDSPIIGIDPVNHLILQRSMFCPQPIGAVDVNARPCLNEYDEHGTLVKTIPNLFTDGSWGYLFEGVNGAARSGATLGQEAYSLSVLSFEAQPYTY